MSTTIIQNNNADLQAILDSINALPEENSGVELPTLTNEGSASDLVSGKELIDQEGNVITGTNPYELNATNAEVEEQADLIAEIKTVLESKASVSYPELSNPATAENLEEGYELIDEDGNIVVGTHVCSGGGGTDTSDNFTCTVTIDNDSISADCPILFAIASTSDGGYLYTYIYREPHIYKITIPNVVCGTKIYLGSSIYQVESSGVYTEIDGSATFNSSSVFNGYDDALLEFTAPTVANEDCTIYYACGV